MAKILNSLNNLTSNNNQSLDNSNPLNISPTLNGSSTENKGFFKLPENLLQLVPFLPLALESMTGQKIPPMGGTMSDIHQNINQITTSLQHVLNNQEKIFGRLVNLETNANNQLVNIDKRLENIQSFRLTHEKERKQLEYNPTPRENLSEDY